MYIMYMLDRDGMAQHWFAQGGVLSPLTVVAEVFVLMGAAPRGWMMDGSEG